LENEPWARDLQEVLFWLEVASLSGEISDAVAKRLRNSNQNLLRFESEIDKSLDFKFLQKRVFFFELRKLDWLSKQYIRLGVDQKTMRNLLRLKERPDDGFFDILSHGDEKHLIIDGVKHKPEAAFQILRAEGLTFDKTIRLIACETGKKATGFAQRFADLTGQRVVAPTTKVRLDDNLEIILEAKGIFKEFKPRQ